MNEIFSPEVKNCSVFKEIALNIVNPLEILREGISNADDANAYLIYITVERDLSGEFIICMEDNGDGMDLDEIHKFFNLGFSKKEDGKIGEKGLGSKIYYKSNEIYLETHSEDGSSYIAKMKNPWSILSNGEIPEYEIKNSEKILPRGTKIIVKGYKIDNPEAFFNLENIKDYIQWFTIGGSFRNIFANNVKVRGLVSNIDIIPQIVINDKINKQSETIVGMHQFEEPNENPVIDIEQQEYKRSNDYSRPLGPFNRETNINGEYVSVQLYGTVSGLNARNKICNLKDVESHKSRFGLYLCKDFIPCMRMNSLIDTERYYHYHLMANSQNFKLTSDRNNISNLDDIKVKWILEQIRDIIENQIKPIAEREYFNMIKKEEYNFKINKKCERTRKKIKTISNVENLGLDILSMLKIPRNEIETVLLLVCLMSKKETEQYINKYFDKILSYSPKLPTDMICIDKEGKKSLVEVEHKLSNFIKHNHPMQLVDYVVCWKIDILENRSYKSNTQEFIFISNHNEKYLAYKDEKIYIIELKSIIDYIKEYNQKSV
ncbi:ATP-binding protein [Intestinibacter sp.]